jgi:hypothetical protein
MMRASLHRSTQDLFGEGELEDGNFLLFLRSSHTSSMIEGDRAPGADKHSARRERRRPAPSATTTAAAAPPTFSTIAAARGKPAHLGSVTTWTDSVKILSSFPVSDCVRGLSPPCRTMLQTFAKICDASHNFELFSKVRVQSICVLSPRGCCSDGRVERSYR